MPTAPPLDSLRVSIDGPVVRDGIGRQLLLRGVNAGGRSKLPPFVPFPFRESSPDAPGGAPPFEEALEGYCDQLRGWGLSLIRLPFSWEALEPEPGRFDETYLERYLSLARACGQRGMRVLVDFHQDVFARPYGGDGFPLWACPESERVPAGPQPHWFMGYLQDERVKLAFDRFWRNDDGLRDAFEAMWAEIAGRAWEIDAVIGFEPINEPGWGNAKMADWGPQVLTPFYERMAAVIRRVAPGAPIFVDATGADALSGTTTVQRPQIDQLVFAPHFYAPEVILEGRWHDSPRALEPLRSWAEIGRRWQVPVLIGELGITPRAEGAASYVTANYEVLDQEGMHATLWECSTTADDWNDEDMSVAGQGGIERATVEALVRPYPAAIAGRLSAFRYDADAGVADLRFFAEADGISEVVVPDRCFPSGPEIELDGIGGDVSHDLASGRVLVRAAAAGEAAIRIWRR